MTNRHIHVVWVAGSRSWTAEKPIIDWLLERDKSGEAFVHGCADGADIVFDRVARSMALPLITVPAYRELWKANGKAAGHIRNQVIASIADELVAFWDGKSTGTAGAIRLAEAKGIPVNIYTEGQSA